MFTLAEIKEIRRNYIYYSDTRELKLQLRARGDTSVKKPEDLSPEERNKIISALFVSSQIREASNSNFMVKAKSEQEILDEIQSDFYQKVLTPEKKSVHPFTLMAGGQTDSIMMKLAHPNEEKNHMAEIYLQHILSENGKKATNIHREIDGGQIYSISYDIENLDRRNDFQKSLDSQNPQWTQPAQKIELTPEQKANRRTYVEKAIQYYNMMEHDEWYQHRVEKEDTDMQRVANIVNNHVQMMPVKNGPGLFYLLKAAQNLSLQNGKDFLEEILSQPEVNKALLAFKSSEQAKKMKAEALENERNGSITKNRHKLGHNLTKGEIDRLAANEYLAHSQHPSESLENARKYRRIKSKAIDKTTLTREEKTKLSLVRVTMRQDGKIPGDMIIENGNISFGEDENAVTNTI